MSKRAFHLTDPFKRLSLRFKVVLAFVFPIFGLVAFLAYDHYLRENELITEQVQAATTQMGDIVLSSLNHSMLINDQAMLSATIEDIGSQGDIQRVWIADLEGVVQQSSIPSEAGMKIDVAATGCVECHHLPEGQLPRMLSFPEPTGQLRIAIPIPNASECNACHPPSEKHLGILLIDVSMAELQARLRQDLRVNLLWSFVIAGLGLIGGYILVDQLVVRRVEALHRAFNAFENGDLSVRVKKSWRTEDEITQLAQSFNRMADSLVRHENEQRTLAQTRQQAIIEERERIARELHDGVAQFIGYVNTKIMAVRLLIKNQKLDEADQQLEQVEQAVQDQSNDVRASIIGLKMASETGTGLSADLREYIDQCNRLSDFPIRLEIDPHADDIRLDVEVELHLLRIIQEAMSNIRKHASARMVQVSLVRQADELTLRIHDDGVGFNPWNWNGEHHAHFGLQTMQERAKMIGAVLRIESEPGQGTTITVQLRLEDS